MFDKTQIVPRREDCQTFFESSFMSIKSDLCDIANTYLNIAFKVHEIDSRIRKDGHKCKYKNIVEACEIELGFKKSTTYNMLNIVKTYGLDENGNVSYKQLLTYNRYSYSQLVEMLSLGEQRSSVTPDTSVTKIRALKAAETRKQNSSRRLEISENTPEVVQMSGNVIDVEVSESSSCQLEIQLPVGSGSKELLKFADASGNGCVLKISREDGSLILEVNQKFYDIVDFLADYFSDLSDDLAPYASNSRRYLRYDEVDRYIPSELLEKFNVFYPIFSRVIDAYKNLEN